jgi:hypothetical protein
VPFPCDKARPRRDAKHSPPSSAEDENEENLYSSPPKPLHGVWWNSFIYIRHMRDMRNESKIVVANPEGKRSF